MTNDIPKILLLIADVSKNYYGDEKSVRDIYRDVIHNFDWMPDNEAASKTTNELRQLIYDKEQRGCTGFDCGEVSIALHKDDYPEVIKFAKKYANQQYAPETLEDKALHDLFKQLTVAGYGNEFWVEVAGPLNVQSTQIQEVQLNPIINILKDKGIKAYKHFWID
jgi:hypothetical protein